MDSVKAMEHGARLSCVRSKNTKPEMLVRQYLHAQGFRYRLHDKSLPGSPDIVLPKYSTVIMVQGCFWHRHDELCGVKARVPKSNTDFWIPKLERNVQRDIENQQALRKAGWSVLVIWECELKRVNRGATLAKLTNAILNNGHGDSSHPVFFE
jgi:DNA mismatch endonuclease (patch repair protein)